LLCALLWALSCVLLAGSAGASPSRRAVLDFDSLFMGKDVKALLDMPAAKDGLDLYVNPKSQKHLDERGIDLKELYSSLKDKGVGVERDAWVRITDVKVSGDRIEVQLSGNDGGDTGRNSDRRDSKAKKSDAGYLRPGGSRINFRYARGVTDADIQADAFLPLLGRVLDGAGRPLDGTERSASIPPSSSKAFHVYTVCRATPTSSATSAGFPPEQQSPCTQSLPSRLVRSSLDHAPYLQTVR